MGRPHPHLDRERSSIEALRIRLGLTLEHASQLTGGRLSTAGWHRLERLGRGSRDAWETAAAALSVSLDAIRPSPGFDQQLRLWGSSS
jgi:hypothetical protein